jgi:hypothetical protein
MSHAYENLSDLASKVDHEGGLIEAAFGYGIPYQDVPDPVVSDLWRQMAIVWHRDMEPLVREIEERLEAAAEEWDDD